jgi:hypothetical protein
MSIKELLNEKLNLREFYDDEHIDDLRFHLEKNKQAKQMLLDLFMILKKISNSKNNEAIKFALKDKQFKDCVEDLETELEIIFSRREH